MESFKINLEYPENIMSPDDISSEISKISIEINGENVTKNGDKTYIEDVAIFLISSLLNSVPDILNGFPQKCIFYNLPFCLDLNPKKDHLEIKPAWSEELEEENKNLKTKVFKLKYKTFTDEVIRIAIGFYQNTMDSTEEDLSLIMESLKEDIQLAKNSVRELVK
ncbi:MAG: hypothetical protein ABIH00_11115 [Armatimonadota bacterium]